jgi:hypothetical protein
VAKDKIYQKLIPRIYRRKYEDLAMYFFVVGQRTIIPAISVDKALYNFFKYVGEIDFNIESARVTFFKIQKEFYENSKTNN